MAAPDDLAPRDSVRTSRRRKKKRKSPKPSRKSVVDLRDVLTLDVAASVDVAALDVVALDVVDSILAEELPRKKKKRKSRRPNRKSVVDLRDLVVVDRVAVALVAVNPEVDHDLIAARVVPTLADLRESRKRKSQKRNRKPNPSREVRVDLVVPVDLAAVVVDLREADHPSDVVSVDLEESLKRKKLRRNLSPKSRPPKNLRQSLLGEVRVVLAVPVLDADLVDPDLDQLRKHLKRKRSPKNARNPKVDPAFANRLTPDGLPGPSASLLPKADHRGHLKAPGVAGQAHGLPVGVGHLVSLRVVRAECHCGVAKHREGQVAVLVSHAVPQRDRRADSSRSGFRAPVAKLRSVVVVRHDLMADRLECRDPAVNLPLVVDLPLSFRAPTADFPLGVVVHQNPVVAPALVIEVASPV